MTKCVEVDLPLMLRLTGWLLDVSSTPLLPR